MEEKRNESQVHIIKAPPSWGKTVLMISAAIDAIREGNKVIMYTTAAMLPTFIREMELMMGSSFPNLSLNKQQDGKYNIIIPSLGGKEQERFNAGESADLLLLTQIYGAHRARIRAERRSYRFPMPLFHRNSPIENYTADFVIIDEAHKGDVTAPIWDNLYRNEKCRFLLVSANDVLLQGVDDNRLFFNRSIVTGTVSHLKSVIINPVVIRFAKRTIEEKIPTYTLEMKEVPFNPFKRVVFDGSSSELVTKASEHFGNISATIQPSFHLEILEALAGTTGNVVVFTPALPKYTKADQDKFISTVTHFQLKDGRSIPSKEAVDFLHGQTNVIIHRTNKDITRFVEKSKEEPTVMLTSYRKGAVGLNFNTVGTVVLMDADHVSPSQFYQAMSRALRVKNRAESIRMIAVVKERTLDAAVKIHFNIVNEDFRDVYGKLTAHKKLLSRATYHQLLLFRSVANEVEQLTEEEIVVLLGPRLSFSKAPTRP